MNHNESDNQIQVFQWASYYSKFDYALFSVPNGTFLNGTPAKRAMQMARLKKEGLKNGVSDIILMIPNSKYHALVIEMKSKKGKLSANQKEFLSDMASNGYETCIAYSAEEAISYIKDYTDMD